MRLLAISDLHLSHKRNREGLEGLAHYPDDWLIVAGDVGERVEHLRFALDTLTPRFAQVIWTPGNHDLWCPPDATDRTRGQARYDQLVETCRSYGVLTPEDPYAQFPSSPVPNFPSSPVPNFPSSPVPNFPSSPVPNFPSSPVPNFPSSPVPKFPSSSVPNLPIYVCPLFLLYDYSFRPPTVTREGALAWARESGVVCGDEQMLDPRPWPSRSAWCAARCDDTEARLSALPIEAETILINHWPLRYDLARPPRVPRFSIWCGTTRTEHWPRRFRARAVVSGHLHMRTTIVRHGVRHEEVSLGYPRDWQQDRGVDWYLRVVLPTASAHASRFVPARDPFMIPEQ